MERVGEEELIELTDDVTKHKNLLQFRARDRNLEIVKGPEAYRIAVALANRHDSRDAPPADLDGGLKFVARKKRSPR